MKLTNKFISLLLVIIIAVSGNAFCSVNAFASESNEAFVYHSTSNGAEVIYNKTEGTVTIDGYHMLITDNGFNGEGNIKNHIDLASHYVLCNTSDFSRLIIRNGITLIGIDYFSALDSLEEITIPRSVKRICSGAFGKCSSLKRINYEGTEKEWAQILIEDNALLNADFDINFSVDVPVSLSTPFYVYDEIQKKDIYKNSIYELNYYKGQIYVQGTGKVDVNLLNPFMVDWEYSYELDEFFYEAEWYPEKYVNTFSFSKGVTELGEKVCSSKYVSNVIIPQTVVKIDKNCFKDCNSLTDIYYYGTAKDWNKIKIASGNEALANAEIHYIPAPGTIKNLSASTTSNSITLSWSKSSNAKEYIVDKYIANKKQWVRVGKTTKTSLKLPAIAGCKYRYRVYAYRDVNYGKKLFGGYTYLEAVAKPKGTTVKSLAAGKKKITVKWNKQATRTSGYQIEYSTNSSFKNSAKIKVSNPNSTSKAITGLKSGKKYYVRVRTYKTATVNGKKATTYSYWSTSKSVKVK